jgi:lipopolysaccharide transport system ATP-binding protein
MEGEPEAVMDYYNALLADHQNQEVRQEVRDDGKVQTISGTGDARLTSVSLCDVNGQVIEAVTVGQPVCLRVAAKCHTQVFDLVVGYMIKDRLGQPVFGTNTHHHDRVLKNLPEGTELVQEFEFQANLGPGTYSVAVALHADDTHISNNYEWLDHALVFNVINTNQPTFVGVTWLPPVIRVKQ